MAVYNTGRTSDACASKLIFAQSLHASSESYLGLSESNMIEIFDLANPYEIESRFWKYCAGASGSVSGSVSVSIYGRL